jgi:hypothetical protein
VKELLKKLLTDTAHVVYGFITSYTSFFNPALSILFFISYFAYQLADNMCEPDYCELKSDVLEYTIGLVVGLVVLII